MDRSTRAPVHLWIIGILAALWNGFGAFDYTMTQMRHATWMAQMTTEQRTFLDTAPYWLHASWALGVWGGLIGALLLLGRSRYAVAAFIVSLLGLAGNTLSQVVQSEPSPHLDTNAGLVLHLAIWAIAIALLAYALRMRAKRVLL